MTYTYTFRVRTEQRGEFVERARSDRIPFWLKQPGLLSYRTYAGICGGIMAGVGTRGVTFYVQTDDVRATLDTAVAHGAEVVMAPVTLPDGVRSGWHCLEVGGGSGSIKNISIVGGALYIACSDD